jgi:hypothetical protein
MLGQSDAFPGLVKTKVLFFSLIYLFYFFLKKAQYDEVGPSICRPSATFSKMF